jgi:hypothetical protein
MTDDINNLRDKLEKKLAEKGYEYSDEPYQNNYGTNPYKSVSDNDTSSYMSPKQDIYAKYDENNEEKPVLKTCPVCELPALYVCNCEKAEVMCKNKHAWWFKKDGSLVLGDPHEEEDD